MYVLMCELKWPESYNELDRIDRQTDGPVVGVLFPTIYEADNAHVLHVAFLNHRIYWYNFYLIFFDKYIEIIVRHARNRRKNRSNDFVIINDSKLIVNHPMPVNFCPKSH